MTSDPYSRVYWSVMSDAKFDGVREDVRLFGSWALMLLVADMAWPAPAFLPPAVTKAALRHLSDCELIDLLPGRRYRVHGLDAERAKRSDSARNAAALRWQSKGNADTMLAEAEPRQSLAETRRDEARAAAALDAYTRDGLLHVTPLVQAAWEDAIGLTLLGSGAFAQGKVDDACRRHPESKVLAAIHEARDSFDHIPDAAAMTVALRNILDPLPSGKATAKATDERSESARHRRAVQATKARAHAIGYHADERDPECDLCRGVAA